MRTSVLSKGHSISLYSCTCSPRISGAASSSMASTPVSWHGCVSSAHGPSPTYGCLRHSRGANFEQGKNCKSWNGSLLQCSSKGKMKSSVSLSQTVVVNMGQVQFCLYIQHVGHMCWQLRTVDGGVGGHPVALVTCCCDVSGPGDTKKSQNNPVTQ